MPIIPIRKSSEGIPCKGRRRGLLRRLSNALPRDERGQGILEYLLVVLVVVGVVFAGAKPVIARLKGKFEKSLKGGIFKDDPTGQQFYYFPLK
jgi:hypothetical protein